MFVVGITGGIGSGKSTVADLFAELGAVIVDADLAAREVVQPGTENLNRIAEHFGVRMLNEQGELNRGKLRETVFADPDAKMWLQRLLHPPIRDLLESQLYSALGPYSMLVSPLLLETEQRQLVDRVLVVDVRENQQLQRTLDRDGGSAKTIEAIMASQLPRAQRLELADDVIDNSSKIDTLAAQVKKLHHFYIKMAAER